MTTLIFVRCLQILGPQQTVQIGRQTLMTLTQGPLRDAEAIQSLEEAATELYKALLAGRDRGGF
jgi:hypothetical protein